MDPVVVGSAVGVLSRLAPEVVKIIDARSERKHELALARVKIEETQIVAANQLEAERLRGNTQYDISALGTLTEAIKSQGQQTGIKWIDALTASVRPIVTYLLVILFIFTKGQEGVQYWGPEDQLLFASVLNFWFVNRVLDKWERR